MRETSILSEDKHWASFIEAFTPPAPRPSADPSSITAIGSGKYLPTAGGDFHLFHDQLVGLIKA